VVWGSVRGDEFGTGSWVGWDVVLSFISGIREDAMEGVCSVYFVQILGGRMKGYADYACNSFGILNVIRSEKRDI
jgi:hypothetical protein